MCICGQTKRWIGLPAAMVELVGRMDLWTKGQHGGLFSTCFVLFFFPPYVFHFVSLHSCSPKTIALFLDLCNLRAGSLLYSEFEKFF